MQPPSPPYTFLRSITRLWVDLAQCRTSVRDGILCAVRIEPGPALHTDSTGAVRERIAKRLGEIDCGRSESSDGPSSNDPLPHTLRGAMSAGIWAPASAGISYYHRSQAELMEERVRSCRKGS